MREFYATLLDSKPVNTEWVDSWADFGPEAGFALHAIPEDIAKEIKITNPPEPRESVPVKLTFEASNAEAVRLRLVELGATARNRRAWDGAWDIVDPEGNIFTLASASKPSA